MALHKSDSVPSRNLLAWFCAIPQLNGCEKNHCKAQKRAAIVKTFLNHVENRLFQQSTA